MVRASAPIHCDLERSHPGIAAGELDDVARIRAAPLMDGLVIVADHARLHTRARQPPDQALLGRIDVLTSVNQVPQPWCTGSATAGFPSSATALAPLRSHPPRLGRRSNPGPRLS